MGRPIFFGLPIIEVNRNDISRVLCRPKPVSVIYLGLKVALRLERPTPRQKMGHLYLPVYLALQPMGCAAENVAIFPGGLLPRLFTLA